MRRVGALLLTIALLGACDPAPGPGPSTAKVKPTTKEWFAAARNYALYANQGGAYDDVIKYLKM